MTHPARSVPAPAECGTRLTLGSLCSGYGGLELAVAEVLDVGPVWVADPAPSAAAVLTHRFPGVPNLGDLTAVDFGQVPRPDVLCAGFPCQDLSYAGRGAGIREGTRSGLWHVIADAVGVLRPRYLVLENVSAIVARRPGLDVVLADLAALGFAAEWTCLRASDVGAPHARNRWILLAADPAGVVADPAHLGHQRPRHPRPGRPGPAHRRDAAADASRDGRNQGRPEPAGQQGRPDAPLGRDGTAADPGRPRRQGHRPSLTDWRPLPASPAGWGRYAPAINRWEHLTGRTAPHPTEPTGRHGADRLSPRFVEWLMGLPDGWVTDVPGLSRNQQLTLLGNGVVPRQGAAALANLFARLAADRTLNEGKAA
ncbi:DNA (cytosine-5)-methyltransferase 1 [Actinomadura mexicana]|uniref:DNA (cytosine-5-)-methyltransferase n=2 Tax=Actinomadura mexicana TaxID=134959 RepID=A0A239HP92_9ACTN|nr:DNA (cytosine-5)-methyltransferase 1 [Actinomadura mexicana]